MSPDEGKLITNTKKHSPLPVDSTTNPPKSYFCRVRGLANIKELRRYAGSSLAGVRPTHAVWKFASTLPTKDRTLVLQVIGWGETTEEYGKKKRK